MINTDTIFRACAGNTNKEIVNLIRRVDTWLRNGNRPTRLIYNVNLVLEELLTNIVKYSYNDSDHHTIRVELFSTSDKLHMRIEDDGMAFNCLLTEPPELGDSLMDCKEGGLGIYLVKQSVEKISYSRKENVNILEVVFNQFSA